jgi:UDP-arabinose 4-epimerase
LVTGGAGYIGSHVAKGLAEHGYDPVVVDDLSEGNAWAVRWGRLFQADICDGNPLDAIIAETRPMAAIHLAGPAQGRESVADPLPFWRGHVGGLLTVATAMEKAGGGPLVFSSSAAVYGMPGARPVAEDHPLAPLTPYGRAKMAAETLLGDLARAGRMRSVSLRYFNAAGADPEAGLGEARAVETHIIPRALDVLCGRGEAVALFGTDHPTPDGTAVRDYVHVGDLADAHVAALDHLAGGGESLALNLGSGRGVSVAELLATVGRVCGRAVPTRLQSRQAGDPPHLVADAAAAERILGWRPRRSAIERIVEDAWRWHRIWRSGAASAGRP